MPAAKRNFDICTCEKPYMVDAWLVGSKPEMGAFVYQCRCGGIVGASKMEVGKQRADDTKTASNI